MVEIFARDRVISDQNEATLGTLKSLATMCEVQSVKLNPAPESFWKRI